MSLPASIERAKNYFDAQLSRPIPTGSVESGSPEGPFITISRESGTGGSILTALLAERLNTPDRTAKAAAPWTVFDHNLVDDVLRAPHLSPQLARFLPEDKVSEVDASVRELAGVHPNLWMLVQQTNVLIRSLATHGHAIIVGRGGNFATAAVRHGLHVRLVAPVGFRAEHLARRLRISVSEAATQNRQTDAARRDYVRGVFDVNVTDPTAYDFVFNVARTSLPAIADLLLPLIKCRETAAARGPATVSPGSQRMPTPV